MLQGLATRGTAATGGLDPLLLLRLASRPTFLAAVALNILGFALHLVALQELPLFLVQAVIASSVVVTAVLSVRVFGAHLTRQQAAAVLTVCAGLLLLAPTATSGEAVEVGAAAPALLLGAVAVVLVLSVAAARLAALPAALALGLLAGTSFGVVAVAARLLPDLSPGAVLREPVAYVLATAGLVAFLLYSTAMQRGSVTTTTAALVVTQTAAPALVGVVLLGDRVRDGLLPVAVVGFALALAGALGLARYEAGAAAGTQAGAHPAAGPAGERR